MAKLNHQPFLKNTDMFSDGSVTTWWTILVYCHNNDKDDSNATYTECMKTTLYMRLYGKNNDKPISGPLSE